MKWLLIILFFTQSAQSQNLAKGEKGYSYPEFNECGLVTRYSSNKINPACLKEALNIVLDEDFSISRRGGSSKYNATPCEDAKAIRGLWNYNAVDGQKYIVINSSNSFFYTKNQGDCVAIDGLSGFNSTAEFDCVQALGELWCLNGIDDAFSWNGASTTTIPSGSTNEMPLGTKIDTFRNRLLVADYSNGKTRVSLSGEGNGTDWTLKIPGFSTSPANIDIAGLNDGDEVTCLMGQYQDTYFIGRGNDLYGLYGNDRRDFRLRKISNEVGCKEDGSVREKNNQLIWLSNRGVEAMSGTQLKRLSDPIHNEIEEIISAAGNSRRKSYNSEDEWEAGLASNEWTSTTIEPGNVVPSTWGVTETMDYEFGAGTLVGVSTNIIQNAITISNYYSKLEDTTYYFMPHLPNDNIGLDDGDISNWSTSGTGFTFSTATLYSFGFELCDNSSILYGKIKHDSDEASQTAFTFNIKNSSDEIQFTTTTMAGLVSSYPYYYVYTATEPIKFEFTSRGGTQVVYSSTYSVDKVAIRLGYDKVFTQKLYTAYFDIALVKNGIFTSQIFDIGITMPIGGVFDATFSTPTNSTDSLLFYVKCSTSPNNDLWGTPVNIVVSTASQSIELGGRYCSFISTFSVSTALARAILYDYTLQATSTGCYITDCINASGVTSWGNFRPTSQLTGNASIDYYVSTGTTCHSVTRSTASWVAQLPNSVITPSTAPYLGTKAVLSPTSSTETTRFNALTVEWQEGESRPPVKSIVYKDRYYLFFTTSVVTGASNDHAFVLDSNNKWTLFDNIKARSAVVYEHKLFTGDSEDTGFLRQQDIGIDDSGTDFKFSFQTADFDFGNPLERKLLKRIYLLLKSEEVVGQNIDLSVNYYIDGSTTAYSLGSAGLNEADESGFFIAKFPALIAQQDTFRWLSLGIEYEGKQGPVNIYGIKLVYTPIDWE